MPILGHLARYGVLLIGRYLIFAQTIYHFKSMEMSSSTFAQHYVCGSSMLRYLPLFNTMNDTPNPPGRLPKPL
jgi:hypothetical protein